MSTNPSQPKVLIKKADGSTVYMTMAELREYQESKKESKTDESPDRHGTMWDDDDHKSLLDPSFHTEVPMVIPKGMSALATSTPVTHIFTDEARFHEDRKVQEQQNTRIVKQENNETRKQENKKTINQVSSIGGRPVMHDVMQPKSPAPAPSRSMSMGPVDELRAFTLTDWRRLAASPGGVKSAMLDKFLTLQKESFILFLDATEAWQQSPMYRLYLGAVTAALQSGKTIAETLGVAAQPEALRQLEFHDVVALNKMLTL